VLTREQTTTLTAVYTYVLSETGQAHIRRALQRRRLPGAFDTDVEEAVLAEASRFLSRGGEITSAAGWSNARITARSIDLARGVIRREAAAPAAQALEETYPDVAEHDATVPEGGLSDLRAAVLGCDASPLDVCGALTVISVLADEASLAPACPQPLAGATREDAACWAGLWYGERHDCFGEGNTTTQRRSRASKRIKAVLRAAAAQGGL